MKKLCSIDGCGNKHLAKGMCRAHYLRMYNKGHLELSKRPSNVSAYEWILQKCVQHMENDCLLYTGLLTSKGYVHVVSDDGSQKFGHVIIYEFHNGKIPVGKEIGHTCHTRNCLNIGHLRAVTHAENIRDSVERLGSQWGVGRLTQEERIERATKAANIRWNKW